MQDDAGGIPGICVTVPTKYPATISACEYSAGAVRRCEAEKTRGHTSERSVDAAKKAQPGHMVRQVCRQVAQQGERSKRTCTQQTPRQRPILGAGRCSMWMTRPGERKCGAEDPASV